VETRINVDIDGFDISFLTVELVFLFQD